MAISLEHGPETEEEVVEINGLGQCGVLKIHDDGDLTVLCGGKKYMVTPEGEIFAETILTSNESGELLTPNMEGDLNE